MDGAIGAIIDAFPILVGGFVGVFGTLAATFLSDRTARTRRRLEVYRNKLEKLHELITEYDDGTCSIMIRFSGAVKLGSKLELDSLELTNPASEIRMIASFYFPTAENQVVEFCKIRKRAGAAHELVASGSIASYSETERQKLASELLDASAESEKSAEKIKSHLAKLAQDLF